MKKILIFYSKTGAGHLRSAEAIDEHLKKADKNLEVLLVDGLSTNNFGKNIHPDKIFHLFSTKLLFLYNFLYTILDNALGVWMLRYLVKLFWEKALKKTVWEFNPDLIVTTHPAITKSIFPDLKIPFVSVCADLGKPHRLWFDKKADKTLVSDRMVLQNGAKIIDESKIKVLGYPLKEDFKVPKYSHKKTGRILILGGGAGVGNLEKQAFFLTEAFPDKRFTIVCGFNEKLENKLKAKNIANLEVLGFSHEIPQLIYSADIVLTKAGPGSIAEAAIMRTPMVITSWVTKQEEGNVDFFFFFNLGIYCPKVDKLLQALSQIYKNYQKYSKGEIELASGSDKIAKFLLSLI